MDDDEVSEGFDDEGGDNSPNLLFLGRRNVVVVLGVGCEGGRGGEEGEQRGDRGEEHHCSCGEEERADGTAQRRSSVVGTRAHAPGYEPPSWHGPLHRSTH